MKPFPCVQCFKSTGAISCSRLTMSKEVSGKYSALVLISFVAALPSSVSRASMTTILCCLLHSDTVDSFMVLTAGDLLLGGVSRLAFLVRRLFQLIFRETLLAGKRYYLSVDRKLVTGDNPLFDCLGIARAAQFLYNILGKDLDLEALGFLLFQKLLGSLESTALIYRLLHHGPLLVFFVPSSVVGFDFCFCRREKMSGSG